MINITQIDESLEIYHNNTVVLWGIEKTSLKMLHLLQYHKVTVHAFCTDTKSCEVLEGLPVLDVAQLEILQTEKKNVIVQLGTYAYDIDLVVKSATFINLCISAQEAWTILRFYAAKQLHTKYPETFLDNVEALRLSSDTYRAKYMLWERTLYSTDAVVISVPPKTGDFTLMKTLEVNDIDYGYTDHRIDYVSCRTLTEFGNSIKVITAVCDPILQNISVTFEYITNLYLNYTRFFDDNNPCEDWSTVKMDAQYFFDALLKNLNYPKISPNFSTPLHHIQSNVPSIQKNMLDIFQVPFDQEKGYTIMKKDNLELFVYQYEKIDQITPALSSFLNKPFSSIVSGGEQLSQGKWTSPAFLQAKKELKFSQEYFDACYNEPYVEHFYCERDIEKMKKQWIDNIDQNK